MMKYLETLTLTLSFPLNSKTFQNDFPNVPVAQSSRTELFYSGAHLKYSENSQENTMIGLLPFF